MSIKIIGAGFPRTGTMTMKKVLEQLGFNQTYHWRDLIANPQKLALWKQLQSTGTTDWSRLFAGFQASVDFPGYPFYQEMMDQYPDAKVILTTRPFEDWYTSVISTIWERKVQADQQPKDLNQLLDKEKQIELCALWMRKTFLNDQFNGKFLDKPVAEKAFYQHHKEVMENVPKEKLLVYEVKDGWQPLCDFLQLSIPEMDFPHLNKKEDFHAMVGRMLEPKAIAT